MSALADLLRIDRSGPLLNDRQQVLRGLVRFVVVAIVVVVASGGIILLGRTADITCLTRVVEQPDGTALVEQASTVDLQVAGTSARADALLVECSRADITDPLIGDSLLFVPAYVLVLGAATALVGPLGYRVRSLRRLALPMTAAVVLAGALDLVENLSVWFGLDGQARGSLHLGDAAAAVSSVAAWPKLVLLTLALLYVAVAALGYVANPFRPGARTADPADPAPLVPDPLGPLDLPNLPTVAAAGAPGTGISLSGGGVRAATYGLGALQALDQAGIYAQARYLSAVSGGSYMAGAWTIARSYADPGGPWAGQPWPWADGSAEVAHFRSRLDYLRSRDGGLFGAIATLGLGLAVNAGSLFVLLWLIARPLGWLVGSPLIGATPDGFTFARYVWLPPLVWALAAVVFLLVWVLLQRVRTLPFWSGRSEVRKVAALLVVAAAVVAVLLGIVLMAVPGAIAAVGNPSDVVHALQTVLGIGVVAAIVGVLKKPAMKLLPKAGGLLVLLFGVAVGGQIAASATTSSFSRERFTYLAVAGAFAVFYFFADPDWWSIQPYYRGRLRYAYATRRTVEDDRPVVADFEQRPEKQLREYAGMRPELVVCAALNVSGGGVPTRVGVPAYSFTFTPTAISYTEPTLADGEGTTYRSPTAWYGRVFRRWDTPRLAVMTAVGMSGAAVSSAMGRFKKGTTGALLALANVRLGMWMPNPRLLGDVPPGGLEGRRPGYPRRRLNYLVKEVFGVYDLDDLYVYVTDGGHWENLGLVELLRRRCSEVFCFDASGSLPDSFGTLAEAITLAAQELGATIELGYEPLRALSTGGHLDRYVARDCAVGVVTYADGSRGILWYAKISLTADAPSRLRAYKEKMDIFPCHPTSDQFFDTEQFETYRELGTFSTSHLLSLRAQALEVLGGTRTATPPDPGPGDLHPDEVVLLNGLAPEVRRRLLDGVVGAPPASAAQPVGAAPPTGVPPTGTAPPTGVPPSGAPPATPRDDPALPTDTPAPET